MSGLYSVWRELTEPLHNVFLFFITVMSYFIIAYKVFVILWKKMEIKNTAQ